ncbi:MAG: phosphotransferase [Acidimicrobiales bacterium]|nr:phosphotransferase [Acidimicrobiales bacterium]
MLDTAFFVMEEIDGIAMEKPDPSVSKQVLADRAFAAVDLLTTLQTADPERTVPGRTWDDAALAKQPARWQALLAAHEDVPGYDGLRADHADPLAAWLDRSVPATWPASLVHGDFHLGNVMFSHTGSETRALVDWELATVGDPRLDLAWLLVTSPLDGDADRGALGPGPWTGFPRGTPSRPLRQRRS